MKRTLSIPEWHRLAAEGSAPPVRITLSGFSMFPLVRGYRDYVTIVPLKDSPVTGDIVLFQDGVTERYIVHRVWDMKDGSVLTWGDNCPGPDGWFERGALLGKVVLIERGRRRIKPDPKQGMRWARFWHQARKLHRFGARCKNIVVRRIRKLKA